MNEHNTPDNLEARVFAVSDALRAAYEAEVKESGKKTGVVHASPEQWETIMGPATRTGYMPVGIYIDTMYGDVKIVLAVGNTTH